MRQLRQPAAAGEGTEVAAPAVRRLQRARRIRTDSIFPPRCFRCPSARSVALVQMRYAGASIEDAMTKFTEKLKESLPDMKCVGWNWSVNIDPNGLRPKIEE